MPKKLILASSLLFACSFSAIAQNQASAADSVIMLSGNQRPEFKGGQEALQKYFLKNLKYPESARKKNIQGDVVISFLIDHKGECKNFKVEKSLHRSCDAEALRVLKEMPRWKPAKVNSVAVATKMHLPVSFRLNNELILEDNSKTKNKYR